MREQKRVRLSAIFGWDIHPVNVWGPSGLSKQCQNITVHMVRIRTRSACSCQPLQISSALCSRLGGIFLNFYRAQFAMGPISLKSVRPWSGLRRRSRRRLRPCQALYSPSPPRGVRRAAGSRCSRVPPTSPLPKSFQAVLQFFPFLKPFQR